MFCNASIVLLLIYVIYLILIFSAVIRKELVKLASNNPDDKVHGANMGTNWGREDPGGPLVGPMNLVILETIK